MHAFSITRRLTTLALGLLMVLGAVTAGAVTHASSASAGSVDVFVAYADNARMTPTHFPTPWAGDPGVIFEGCLPPQVCVFDAGAVQVYNNTSTTITVDSITVTVGACKFTGWAPASVPPGGRLIVTQIAAAPAAICGQVPPLTMDTSDFGTNGCNDDGVLPTVDVSVNGTSTTYTDKGQVLNTGGFDEANCLGTNESAPWTTIGQAPCPQGQQLTLAPASQNATVFSTATITATLTACGQPIGGAPVTFNTNSSSVNYPLSGASVTDSMGNASFTYTSAQQGTDYWTATVVTGAGPLTSNTAKVIWGLPQGTALCSVDVTNGGWMIANDGNKVSFGGNASSDESATATGQEQYTDSPANLDIHSINILVITCSNNGEQADIYGTATENGLGSFLFRIEVTDPDSTPSAQDTYWIKLANYDSGSHQLGGGEIEIHKS